MTCVAERFPIAMAGESDDTWVIFMNSKSDDETATHRVSESYSTVSSVHTCDLTDFSREIENDIRGGITAPATLGFDLASAYTTDWLIDFSERASPLVHTAESTACEFFGHYFSLDLLRHVVTETNSFASECLANKHLGPHSRNNSWIDVTEGDIRAFLAVLLLMGLHLSNSQVMQTIGQPTTSWSWLACDPL